MSCDNCKLVLSCACQTRTASNGVRVCVNCLTAYEQSLQLVTTANHILANTAKAR